MGRITNVLLLILIVVGIYWFLKQPEMRGETEQVKEAIAALPDKAIDAAAKISNRIEDAPEKTQEALDKAKEEIKETKDHIKSDFEDAKAKDREQQQQ